jgi:hypothetical protein
VPSALHAFNAENIANELWNSTMNAVRDDYGAIARFMPPVVANGKVYVATWSDQVAVYGLLPDTVSPTSLAFGGNTTGVASTSRSVTLTNPGATAWDYSQTNTCGTFVPVGLSCAIEIVFTPTAAGSLPAALDVIGGPGSGKKTVTLSGTGT